jgi:thiol-disulfide isomerase/thioredoxin
MKLAYLLLAALTVNAASVAGLWDATVTVNQTEIPFRLQFAGDGRQLQGWFFNGDEKVTSTSGYLENGRLLLQLDHYATRLEATLKDGVLEGQYGRPGRQYPFRAQPHAARQTVAANAPNIDGLWEIAVKSPKGESAWRLVVNQKGDEASAAILRVDGDTGALTGRFHNGRFVLSHFSGARPALLTLTPNTDGSLTVDHSGRGVYTALRPQVARAKGLETYTNPALHTKVQDPAEPLHFRFPNLRGKLVSDADFRGKVVLVNVTGSWCPNCHDEAPFLAEIYAKYKSRGLEIVALSFEEAEQLQDPTRLRAFIKQYGLQYTVLLGGEPSELQAKLPQAVNLNSWGSLA